MSLYLSQISHGTAMSTVLDLAVVNLGTIGAEVRGVDLARVTATEVQAIKQAWYSHDVLLFREQRLIDDALLALSRHFGTLDARPNQGRGVHRLRVSPEVFIVSNMGLSAMVKRPGTST
jgi:alpha-ketoglutarate-dependent taurine dioxygenase